MIVHVSATIALQPAIDKSKRWHTLKTVGTIRAVDLPIVITIHPTAPV